MRLASNARRLIQVAITALALTVSAGAAADAHKMPGKGVTVKPGIASWTSAIPVSWVYRLLLEDLGYEVQKPTQLSNPVAYLAVREGDIDYWPNGWFPLHNAQLPNNFKANATLFEPLCQACGIQGYLVDKKSADKYNITSIEDFKREEVRKAFDHNGDGKADLYGCPPGWGCYEGINAMLDKFNAREYINHVDAGYSANFAEVLSQVNTGNPALYYTWGPSAWLQTLKPGEDVVWVNAPGIVESDSEKVSGVPGAATDPIMMGFVAADIQVAANDGFLSDNPAAKELFRQVRIPLAWINQADKIRGERNMSDEDVSSLAQKWLDENRAKADAWLKAARNAAM